MRRLTTVTTIVLAAAIILSGVALAAKSLEGKTYGKGVSDHDAIAISHLIDHHSEYIGKTVRVQGTAVQVCQHRGCWISIASDREGETLRVKVEDGEIIFPPEIVGETVIAEGVFTVNNPETLKKTCDHAPQKAEVKTAAATKTTCASQAAGKSCAATCGSKAAATCASKATAETAKKIAAESDCEAVFELKGSGAVVIAAASHGHGHDHGHGGHDHDHGSH